MNRRYFLLGLLTLTGCDTVELERRMALPITVEHRMSNSADRDSHMRCRMGNPMPDRSWERESASERHPYEVNFCGSVEADRRPPPVPVPTSAPRAQLPGK